MDIKNKETQLRFSALVVTVITMAGAAALWNPSFVQLLISTVISSQASSPIVELRELPIVLWYAYLFGASAIAALSLSIVGALIKSLYLLLKDSRKNTYLTESMRTKFFVPWLALAFSGGAGLLSAVLYIVVSVVCVVSVFTTGLSVPIPNILTITLGQACVCMLWFMLETMVYHDYLGVELEQRKAMPHTA